VYIVFDGRHRQPVFVIKAARNKGACQSIEREAAALRAVQQLHAGGLASAPV